MNHATFFISQTQYDWLAAALPQPAGRTGRPAVPNNELLNGILFVLKTGCRWQDLPASICTHGYSSCWRRLRFKNTGTSNRYGSECWCSLTTRDSSTYISAIWMVRWSRLRSMRVLGMTPSITATVPISRCSPRRTDCHS